tara:strand:- start:366 stop:812 length:447 start_codon:yes stop_codon:yes gene_type:complete
VRARERRDVFSGVEIHEGRGVRIAGHGKTDNYFARIGHGKPNFAPQLGVYEGFVICHKTAEHYDDPEYKKGAMAGPDENGPGHVFLTTTNLDWKYFNVAVIDDVEIRAREKVEQLWVVLSLFPAELCPEPASPRSQSGQDGDALKEVV